MTLKNKPSRIKQAAYFLLSLLSCLVIVACGTATPPRPDVDKLPTPPPRLIKKPPLPPAPALKPLAEVKPVVAKQEKMPFDSKVFSLSARSAPLQDVLMGLAKEAKLNLVIEKEVNPLEKVSIEVHNLSLRKAMDLLFSAYDYFYTIDGNILTVKAVETKFFKLEVPVFHSTAKSEVGGDVLGSGGGGGGGGSTSGLTGEFSVETKAIEKEIAAWDQLADALKPLAKETTKGGEAGLLSELGRARIDRASGTIVVTDRRENLELVEKYLNLLRNSLRRQVVIEARIIEVTLNDQHQFGVDWDFLSGDVSLTQRLRTGVGALNLGIVGSSGHFLGDSFFLEALSNQGKVNVLSSPRVNVLNNQSAVLNVGRTIPYLEWTVQATTTAEGTNVFTAVPLVARAQAGISLGVTPFIGEDGVTTLNIVPIVTDLVAFKNFTFEGNSFDVPIIDVRGTATIVRAADGETVIIAGMIQDKNSDNVAGIPFLKDIPYLGVLFSSQNRTKQKVELVISLTPTVLER